MKRKMLNRYFGLENYSPPEALPKTTPKSVSEYIRRLENAVYNLLLYQEGANSRIVHLEDEIMALGGWGNDEPDH